VNKLLEALRDYEEGMHDVEALEVFLIRSGASVLAEELAELVDNAMIDVYGDTDV